MESQIKLGFQEIDTGIELGHEKMFRFIESENNTPQEKEKMWGVVGMMRMELASIFSRWTDKEYLKQLEAESRKRFAERFPNENYPEHPNRNTHGCGAV